jgi:competence protein ComEA
MRPFLRSLFAFSATETRGFWVFLLLLGLGWLIFWIYLERLPAVSFLQAEDSRRLDSLYALFVEADSLNSDVHPGVSAADEGKTEALLFPFDPNTADFEELSRLGFSERLARQLLAYRKAGGSFRVRSDLRRLYSMPDSLYEKLQAYILLPETEERIGSRQAAPVPKPAFSADSVHAVRRKKEPLHLDVNTADSVAFLALYGIGPAYAGRLLRFRTALGGFVSVEQVKEMYGLPPEIGESILSNLYVDPSFKPRQIPLNTASIEELAEHPYISFPQARVLVAYRQSHGPFTSLSDLLKIHTFNQDFVEKIRPYLRIDD